MKFRKVGIGEQVGEFVSEKDVDRSKNLLSMPSERIDMLFFIYDVPSALILTYLRAYLIRLRLRMLRISLSYDVTI